MTSILIMCLYTISHLLSPISGNVFPEGQEKDGRDME